MFSPGIVLSLFPGLAAQTWSQMGQPAFLISCCVVRVEKEHCTVSTCAENRQFLALACFSTIPSLGSNPCFKYFCLPVSLECHKTFQMSVFVITDEYWVSRIHPLQSSPQLQRLFPYQDGKQLPLLKMPTSVRSTRRVQVSFSSCIWKGLKNVP